MNHAQSPVPRRAVLKGLSVAAALTAVPVAASRLKLPKTSPTSGGIQLAASSSGTLASDDFNRADSNTALGGPVVGPAWQVTPGSTWGIASNQARMVATGTGNSHVATTVATQADCTIQCTFPVNTNQSIAWRLTDIQNFFQIDISNGAVWRRKAGTFTRIANCSASGTGIWSVTLAGATVTIKKDGATVVSFSDTFNQTAVNHGLHCYNNTVARWDDFIVTGGTAGGTTAGVPVRVDGWWWGDLESVPLGSAGNTRDSGTPTANALNQIWDYWDMPGLSVVDRVAEGLPATPWGGSRVCKWVENSNDPNVYKKLYRTMKANNWPSGSPSISSASTSPADVSARYIVYQYIPSAQFHLNPGHGWVIFNAFKENYHDANNNFHQDPTTYYSANNFQFGGATKYSYAPHTAPSYPISDILDRWFKVEHRLYQGVKCEVYVDDVLKDTITDSEVPIGSAAFVPLNQTEGWIWLAGQYTSNQTTNGIPDYVNTSMTSYVGLSCMLPLPS